MAGCDLLKEKAASWSDPRAGDANEAEILFFALLNALLIADGGAPRAELEL